MPGHTSAPAFEFSALLRADPVFSMFPWVRACSPGARQGHGPRLLYGSITVCCLIGPRGNSLALSLSSSLPHSLQPGSSFPISALQDPPVLNGV